MAKFFYESSFPRSPPHPFITVLTSSPEQATVLIQQVNLLLVNSININRYKAPHHVSSFWVQEETLTKQVKGFVLVELTLPAIYSLR